MIPQEIIILAGGKGTRLRSVLGDRPKSLAPIGNKRFIDYLISYYLKQGLKKIIICLGEGHQQICDHLQEVWSDLDIELVIETMALDTGGAIRSAMDHVIGDTVLAVNGDSYFMVELGRMAAFHHMCGAACTIAVKKVPDAGRYGGVELNKDYSISSFREKGMEGEGFINGGVYLINTRMFRANHFPERFSFEKDYLQQYFREKRIYAVRQEGYFIDIGIPEDLVRAQQEIIDHDKQLDA